MEKSRIQPGVWSFQRNAQYENTDTKFVQFRENATI